MTYAITYSSSTGNTKALADALENCLNKESCIYCGDLNTKALDADVLFVGFWTDQGTCDNKTKEFLQKLEHKKVFLFGTAGFGKDSSYFDRIISRIKPLLSKTNELIGSYMCQGRMPLKVRERYEKIKEQDPNTPNIDMLIENFDEALPHPTRDDIVGLIKKVQSLPC